MNKITPFLWFNDNAEDVANFYLSIFPDGRKLNELRATEAGPGPVGSLVTVELELNGQQMTFLNGGPHYKLSEAFSFFVSCDTQAEIDYYWDALLQGGTESQCGWLKDKFGLSWQIVPKNISELIRHPNAMKAMMGMVKLDIATLEAAAKS